MCNEAKLLSAKCFLVVNKERLANNNIVLIDLAVLQSVSGGFVAPIYNGSLRKNLFKTKFKL